MSYFLRDSGLGDLTLPPPAVWIYPGYPPDPTIVAANTAASNAYQAAVAAAQVSNNDAQCISNANQNPEPYRTQMLAACGGSYSPGGSGYDAAESIPYVAPASTTPVASPVIAQPINFPAQNGGPVLNNVGGAIVPSTPVGSSSPAPVQPASSSFSLSSVPWWGWLAGVGVALLAVGGSDGR